MSKNSFKTVIRERYRGRGNCWIKVPFSSPVYRQIIDTLKDNNDASSYIVDIEREGFMSLLGNQKTLDRIQYLLMNNKPLRN